jgi:hypothetical protein
MIAGVGCHCFRPQNAKFFGTNQTALEANLLALRDQPPDNSQAPATKPGRDRRSSPSRSKGIGVIGVIGVIGGHGDCREPFLGAAPYGETGTVMVTGAKQSRTMSFVEAATNVIIGYVTAVLVQLLTFPMFGIAMSMTDNLAVGVIFTVVSIMRSFVLRRVFEEIRARELRRSSS